MGRRMWAEDQYKLSKQRRLIREASLGEYSCKTLKDNLDLYAHMRTVCNYLSSSDQLKFEVNSGYERISFAFLKNSS